MGAAKVRRIEAADSWVVKNWNELAAVLSCGSDYNATITDAHFGATEPLPAKTCQCEPGNFLLDRDAGEDRCWKCGRP